jgi:diguanylate cyclase (GGDEF)-like protein
VNLKNIKLSKDESKYFKYILSRLTKSELKNKKVSTLYSLIDILFQRVEKKVIISAAIKISNVVGLMGKYLNDAIMNNKNHSSNIKKIKTKINSIKLKGTTKDELIEFKSKLIQIANSMEDDINNINNSLKSEQNELNILKDKIKQLEEELAQTKEDSSIDHLTRLLVRKVYEEQIERFEKQYIENQEDYAIVFFDLDNFKKINDNYGHECGDTILKTFAEILIKITKETDILGRYGGEEFIAAVKYTNEKELVQYVSKIKNFVTSNKFKYKELKLDITFSAGVDVRSNYQSYTDTVRKADILLFKAKDEGKNKILFSFGETI